MLRIAFQSRNLLSLVPSGFKSGIVKLDYDMNWGREYKNNFHVSRPTRNNAPARTRSLPATARMVSGGSYQDLDTVEFGEKPQKFMFGLCRQASPIQALIEAIKDFTSAFTSGRALCDFAGADIRANHIAGTNLDQGPVILKPMLFGGNWFVYDKIMDVPGNGLCFRVKAINVNKDTSIYHPATHPYLFFCPTNSAREPILDSKGNRTGWLEYISEPWHQFQYRMVMPLFSNRDYLFLPISRGYEFVGNQIPSPYAKSPASPYYPNPYQ